SYAYDKLDHQVQADEGSWDYSTATFTPLRRTTRVFDVLGNVMRETTGLSPAGSPYQANASTSEARYDALGRKVSVREAEGTDSERVTSMAYDMASRLLSVSKAGYVDADAGTFSQIRVTSYGYDLLGRRTDVIEAWASNANRADNKENLGHDAPLTHTIYNATDTIRSVTNPRGVRTDYRYDLFNRQVRVEEGAYVPPEMLELFPQWPGSKVTSTTYDKDDEVVLVEDALHTRTSFGYDTLGRQTDIVEALGQPEQRATQRQY